MARRWLLVTVVAAACSATAAPPTTPAVGTNPPPTIAELDIPSSLPSPPTTRATTTTTLSPHARPQWLGTRELPLREDGHGEVQPTPVALVDRQLETIDVLPPPAGEDFEWTVSAVPEDVLARSSWSPECPVSVEELAYVTVSHYGFDARFHTGELLVNATYADGIVEVFRALHAERFPIEQMRVIRAEEIDAPPTGDWNDTTSFVCRPAVGSNSWSQHAYGLAIDINPFHNPYLKGDLVLPELAAVYTDREDLRPGMIGPGDAVVAAFAEIGWKWGGNWNSLKDWMHFSASGG